MKIKVTRSIFLLLALATLGLVAAGCYTVLVHPTVETTGDVASARTCSDCHASTDYYYWHYPHQYDWYSGHSSWSRYYYDPWWWDNYWYWDGDHGHGHGHGDGGGSGPTEHLWQPRTAPAAEPTIAPGTSGTSRDASKSGDKGSGTDTKQESNKESQRLWQPRVPPKSADDAGAGNSGQGGKGDAQPQEESEGN